MSKMKFSLRRKVVLDGRTTDRLAQEEAKVLLTWYKGEVDDATLAQWILEDWGPDGEIHLAMQLIGSHYEIVEEDKEETVTFDELAKRIEHALKNGFEKQDPLLATILSDLLKLIKKEK